MEAKIKKRQAYVYIGKGNKRPETKKRKCLKCDKVKSIAVMNRICDSCRLENSGIIETEFRVML